MEKKLREILFKGLTLQIKVTSYTPARPAPMAQTPDCPGYADPGDAEEVEFTITGAEIDCQETFIESLAGLESDEELGGLVIAAMSNE